MDQLEKNSLTMEKVSTTLIPNKVVYVKLCFVAPIGSTTKWATIKPYTQCMLYTLQLIEYGIILNCDHMIGIASYLYSTSFCWIGDQFFCQPYGIFHKKCVWTFYSCIKTN